MRRCLIIALLFISLFTLTSCEEKYTFSPYSYQNEPPIKADILPDFINCDDMVVDGEKEDCYGENVTTLYYKNKNNHSIHVNNYFYFGETGIHCFVEVRDDIISFVGTRAVYYNSSIELFFNDWNKNYIDGDTLQYRISAGGSFTKFIGLRNESSYASSYFDGVFKVKMLGEFFTPGAEGFNVEVFIPWYELGFTSADEVDGLMYMVAYNSVHDTSGDSSIVSRARTSKMLGFQATPYTWVPVERQADNSGKNITPDGSFFGRNDMYESSYGFDFSKDDGVNNVVTLDKASSASYTFVKDYYGTNFYYEVQISDVGGVENNHPKIGITTFILSNRITLYVKLNEPNRCGLTQRNDANSGWNWTVEEGGTYTNESFVNKNDDFASSVKLAIYRKDDLLCFFVNDELLFATKDSIDLGDGVFVTPKMKVLLHGTETIDDYNEESIVGIYSYAATATISNYYLLRDEEADNKLKSMFN